MAFSFVMQKISTKFERDHSKMQVCGRWKFATFDKLDRYIS